MARALSVVELAEGVHGLVAGVNCAVIEAPDKTAVLVDSGQDADHGKGVKRALAALGLTPTAIICTHSHADHFGGNAYLLRQFPDIEVFAPEVEADVIRAPELEPIALFHGAAPLPELRSSWLMAPASPVHREVEAGAYTVAGVPLELIDVRGHAHRQLAVKVGDVLLAADAVFGSETLTRYPLPFGQDVAGQLSAHDTVAAVDARVLLPGHGAPTVDVQGIVEENRRAVTAANDAVADAVSALRGGGTEDVLAACGGTLGLEMNDLARYHLNFCTVSAHLGYLRATGRIVAELSGGRLAWRSAS
mgnify:CR=1 FL=1